MKEGHTKGVDFSDLDRGSTDDMSLVLVMGRYQLTGGHRA